MGFEFKLSVSVFSEQEHPLERSIFTKEQTLMSDSWGAQKAAALKARAEKERIKQETELREQDFINQRARSMWQELSSTLRKMATDLNRHYGEDYLNVTPLDSLDTLYIQSPKGNAELRFNSAIPEITISPALDAGREARLKFSVESREVLFAWVGGVTAPVGRTAEWLLDKFV